MPDSISLFAGGGGMEPWPSWAVLEARGMVEISRVVPREEEGLLGGCVVLEEEEEKGERSQENMPPLFELAFVVEEDGGGWVVSVEELLDDVVGVGVGREEEGFVGGAKGECFGPLFFNQASRVAWSTGQASTDSAEGVEGWLDILVVCL